MNELSESSIDKSWDHSWMTKEMRTKRRDWSLAGDVGLLKSLQSFHRSVSSKAEETWKEINNLSKELDETAVLVDNVTNISLALANTQFIESRVQEEDIESIVAGPLQNQPTQAIEEPEVSTNTLIATVSESILQGLKIMDEKYDQIQVDASDSEDEGDNEVSSIILKAKDPYQDRFLPHIIGTEKWRNSSKIGLEYSSSDSDQIEEENNDEEYWKNDGDDDGKEVAEISSIGEDFGNFRRTEKQQETSDISGTKQDSRNQSESATPKSSGPLNFAEELAKRLQNVPGQKKLSPAKESIVSDKSKGANISESESEQDFPARRYENDRVERKNEKGETKIVNAEPPLRSELSYAIKTKTSYLAPSMDIPPPMSNISIKNKSAIDDLFDNGDSDDSDDIFSSKSTRKITQDVMKGENKIPNLFENDTDDDLFSADGENHLFGGRKEKEKSDDEPRKEIVEDMKKKPIGGISIFGQVDPSILLQKQANVEKAIKRVVVPSENVDNISGNETDGPKHSTLKIKKGKNAAENSFENMMRAESEPPPILKNPNKPKSKTISIFDDSESEDDLFSNSSSKLPKSHKLPSMEQRKPKVRSRKSIFDDDNDDQDDDEISQVSADTDRKIDILASEEKTDLFAENNEELFSDFGTKMKSNSIFDESDEDLFGASSTAGVFDGGDENKYWLPKSERPVAVSPGITGEKQPTTSVVAKNIVARDTELPSGQLFQPLVLSNNDGEENQAKPANIVEQIYHREREEVQNNRDEMSRENEEKKVYIEEENKERTLEKQQDDKLSPKNEGKEEEPVKVILKKLKEEKERDEQQVDGGFFSKRSHEEPGREKVKSLMGKIGNLKILSPTDTPPLFRKKTSDEEEGDSSDTLSSPSNRLIFPSPLQAHHEEKSHQEKNSTLVTQKSKDDPRSDNSEIAVSFDEPAKIEALSSTASKSRAKIKVKRRPQSRHARQNALRHSGIDYDLARDSKTNECEVDSVNERLRVPGVQNRQELTIDLDKSQVSKGSCSTSLNNKNTLLSPSTDEEDLFDVLPELPQDSPREEPDEEEDALFGEAPLISPFEEKQGEEDLSTGKQDDKTCAAQEKAAPPNKEPNEKLEEEEKPSDPLRSQSDPLQDPSQLFAFVTKTSSPSKDKVRSMLMQQEDDGIFSSPPIPADTKATKNSSNFDLLFDDDDDAESNLFLKAPMNKRPKNATRVSLFDDDDDQDDVDASLWQSWKGKDKSEDELKTSAAKRKEQKEEEEEKQPSKALVDGEKKQSSLFEDDDEEDSAFLFTKDTQSKSWIKSKNLQDIFNDGLSQDAGDDLFGSKSKGETFEAEKGKNNNGEEKSIGAEKKSMKKDFEKQATTDDPLSLLGDE